MWLGMGWQPELTQGEIPGNTGFRITLLAESEIWSIYVPFPERHWMRAAGWGQGRAVLIPQDFQLLQVWQWPSMVWGKALRLREADPSCWDLAEAH